MFLFNRQVLKVHAFSQICSVEVTWQLLDWRESPSEYHVLIGLEKTGYSSAAKGSLKSHGMAVGKLITSGRKKQDIERQSTFPIQQIYMSCAITNIRNE